MAGGTDLLGDQIDRFMPVQPQYIINLKTITPSLDYIKTDSTGLKIGALTRLHDIANSSAVQTSYPALSQAANKVASWQIRNMGTIGGNICQQVRCWYFRSSLDKFPCLRKDPKGLCYAMAGDNRYHSIFGASNGCLSVNPSDIAPVLVALNASVITNKRTLAADGFFNGFTKNVLANDELITEIDVPTPPQGSKQAFVKASVRKAIDFALVSATVFFTPATGTITDARIVLGGVAGTPLRVKAAESAIIGQAMSATTAQAASSAAVTGATTLPLNKYKAQMAIGLVSRALLS
jgi:xanthine dehydrogenase YagS FAD-binding subunit